MRGSAGGLCGTLRGALRGSAPCCLTCVCFYEVSDGETDVIWPKGPTLEQLQSLNARCVCVGVRACARVWAGGLTAQLFDGGPLLGLLPGLGQVLVGGLHRLQDEPDAVLQRRTETKPLSLRQHAAASPSLRQHAVAMGTQLFSELILSFQAVHNYVVFVLRHE